MTFRALAPALLALSLAAPFGAGTSELLPVSAAWQIVDGVQGIRVTMAGGGQPLMDPNGQAILSESACETQLSLQAVDGGFDLVVTVHNATTRPEKAPAIALTGVRLDKQLTYLDARRTGALKPWNAAGASSKWSSRFNYPDHLYSPVLTLADRRAAIGVSFIYDALNERHGMSTFWGMEGGKYYGTYRIDLEPFVRDKIGEAAAELVPAGDTQHYRVAVRFASPDRWLDTLKPYRQDFRARYGSVRYQADLTPVWGEPVAQAEFRNEHPRGYNPDWKVDEDGWSRFVDHVLKRVAARGYRRIMVWAPSGLYKNDDSYPVEFMTAWSAPMIRTAGELNRLRDAGVKLGMWWGQAGQVSGGFNSERIWTRRLSNPSDVEAGNAELRLAERYGVQEVGLDAINAMPLWDRYVWLRQIEQQHPSVRFITETADCDIMHTIAPTFYNWRDHDTAPILTDWLNPGHETWVQLWYNEATSERFRRIRAWGLVPVTMTTIVPHDSANRRGAGSPSMAGVLGRRTAR